MPYHHALRLQGAAPAPAAKLMACASYDIVLRMYGHPGLSCPFDKATSIAPMAGKAEQSLVGAGAADTRNQYITVDSTTADIVWSETVPICDVCNTGALCKACKGCVGKEGAAKESEACYDCFFNRSAAKVKTGTWGAPKKVACIELCVRLKCQGWVALV